MSVDTLDAGIADLVMDLRRKGYTTTDSGDGSKASWMEGALPFRHVFVQVEPFEMIRVSQQLASDYPDATVEATFSPRDGVALIGVYPDGYESSEPPRAKEGA